jgi:hypothetical protein
MIFTLLEREQREFLKAPQQGDLIKWLKSNKGVCIITFTGLTGLDDIQNGAGRTWTFSLDQIHQKLKDGTLEYLSKGSIIQLKQE